MADALETVNIDVKTNTSEVKNLDAAIEELKKSLKELDALKKENGELTDAETKSYKQLEDQLKNLEQQQKEASKGIGESTNLLKGLSPVVGDADKLLGKFGTSMGDLASKGTKSFSSIGTSFSALGKAFMSNPIGLVITGIALVVSKLVEAFKKNDDAMTSLQKAFTVFSPILEGINFLFDKLAEGIAFVVGGIADLGKAILSLVPGYDEAQEAAESLVQAQDDLEAKEREYIVHAAERNKEISKLRNEANDTKDIGVRMEKLQQAIALEKANLEEEKQIAAERLRITIETAKKEKDTSDETQKKIAEQKAALYEAEQKYYDGTRRLAKELAAEEDKITKALSKQEQQIYKNTTAELTRQKFQKQHLQLVMKTYEILGKTEDPVYQRMQQQLTIIDEEIAKSEKTLAPLLAKANAANNKASEARKKNSNDEKKAAEEAAKALEEAQKAYDEYQNKQLSKSEQTINSLNKEADAVKKNLKTILDAGKMTQEEYDAAIKKVEESTAAAIANIRSNTAISEGEKSISATLEESASQYNDQLLVLQEQVQNGDITSYSDYLEKKQELDNNYQMQRLDAEMAASDSLIALYEQELASWAGTVEEKEAIEKKLAKEREKRQTTESKKNAQLLKKQADDTAEAESKKKKAMQNSIKVMGDVSNALGAASKLAGDNVEAQKGIQSAQVVIDTASGVAGALSSAAGMGPVGWALGAIQAAAITASGIASLQEIHSADKDKDNSLSSNTSSFSAPPAAVVEMSSVAGLTDSTIATPIEMSNDQIASISEAQKVYVLESDISSTQKKVEVMESNNSL